MTDWYVPCGCEHHGDHLGCDNSCKEYGGGCQHPLGVVVTSSDEEDEELSPWFKDGKRVTKEEMDEAFANDEPGLYGFGLDAFLDA